MKVHLWYTSAPGIVLDSTSFSSPVAGDTHKFGPVTHLFSMRLWGNPGFKFKFESYRELQSHHTHNGLNMHTYTHTHTHIHTLMLLQHRFSNQFWLQWQDPCVFCISAPFQRIWYLYICGVVERRRCEGWETCLFVCREFVSAWATPLCNKNQGAAGWKLSFATNTSFWPWTPGVAANKGTHPDNRQVTILSLIRVLKSPISSTMSDERP